MSIVKMDVPSGFTYLLEVDERDTLQFRIKEVTDEASAKDWISKFSECTKITWRVARTFPNAGKINIFKLELRCQHFTDKRAQGSGPSKNTNCPATLQIVVKRYYEKSQSKKIDNLVKDWPTVCCLKNAHNHATDNAAALRHRDLSEKSRETLCSLFRKGHSPSSALQCLKTNLLLEHGEEYYKIAADGFHVPSTSVVSKLFQKEFSTTYGGMTGPQMFEGLKKLLGEYNSSSSGKTTFNFTEDGKHYFVILITPIMLRVHETVDQSGELVLVDASGGVDKQRHRIYFFVTPTSAGGLPLGVIITDTEKESVFYEALLTFKTMLGDQAFNGTPCPKVFLTDNDLKERNPLQKLYPASKLLLCQFHFLKCIWSWLCNKKNDIDGSDRQELYFFLKNMVYAESDESLIKIKEKMFSAETYKRSEKFKTYFNHTWDQRCNWASCYRKHLPTRGTNTTNYVEVVFRILKDCILNRIMAFNITQLVDYILCQYEEYMQKRLIDFTNGRLSKSVISRFLPKTSNIPSEKSVISRFLPKTSNIPSEDISYVEGDDDCYIVKSQSSEHNNYYVDVKNAFCTCLEGQTGKICKHASAVLMRLSSKIITGYNLVSESTKKKMFYVATGSVVSSDWFAPLAMQKEQPQNEIMAAEEVAQINDNTGVVKDLAGINVEPPECQPLSASEMEDLDAIFKRIKDGLNTDPHIFNPAVRKMIKNAKTSASTQNGLVSALHTFATYSGASNRSHHGQSIGVQPTAVSRRKSLFSGKRKLSAGRPTSSAPKRPRELHGHDYTPLGSLPSRKIRSQHNLQDCVDSNKSLGGRKNGRT